MEGLYDEVYSRRIPRRIVEFLVVDVDAVIHAQDAAGNTPVTASAKFLVISSHHHYEQRIGKEQGRHSHDPSQKHGRQPNLPLNTHPQPPNNRQRQLKQHNIQKQIIRPHN
ncbi:hypothetical protein K458DRAFT_415890 [Lentithecium fluviatile CBS 122367]|uniref:Uncharacterized protein n=1 Tax=Lentithecium fluviatile CBS 122367 TaxID=1168545 RepID=A0A6G1J8M2_9PLEO|nr:hypothetical protein K458DRAFT_415890 [Lentithecium fluviatile CBS 122367]